MGYFVGDDQLPAQRTPIGEQGPPHYLLVPLQALPISGFLSPQNIFIAPISCWLVAISCSLVAISCLLVAC